MSDQLGAVIGRVVRLLNRRTSDLLALLHHKGAGSFGALAGFAIAVVFAWRLLRPSRGPPKPPAPAAVPRRTDRVDITQEDLSVHDEIELIGETGQTTLSHMVRKKLSGCRKVTCQLLGVILEERTPEELQKNATVRSSVLEVLLEISKYCDVYLMETILDDESEERVLAALQNAGIFQRGGLMKEKVLFCSTNVGRTSFVRQLAADIHIDSNLDIITQLSRFIRYLLLVSPLEPGHIAPNVFSSSTLEQYFL